MKTIAFVDGDLLCFRAAAANEVRSVSVTHTPSQKSKTFKNRTEFKKSMIAKFGEDGWEAKMQNYELVDMQESNSLSIALRNVKSRIDKLKTALCADEIEVYINAGGDVFRHKLDLPTPYKGFRTDILKPLQLADVKRYAIERFDAKLVSEIETDDMVTIRAYEELAKGNKAIICTSDKDAGQSSGIYIHDWTVENPTTDHVPEIGWLKLTPAARGKPAKVEGLGLKFLAYQLLFGDPVDAYKPSAVAGKRYGAVSAFNALNERNDADSILQAVVDQYKEWYPEPVTYTTHGGREVTKDWSEMLELYFKCAYMHRCMNDTATWVDFFREKGYTGETK